MKVTQMRVYEGSILVEICDTLEEAKQVAREFIQEPMNFEVEVYEVESVYNQYDELVDIEKTKLFEIEKYEDNTTKEFEMA